MNASLFQKTPNSKCVMAYHLTDHDIQALIDNELDQDQEKFVKELIKKNIYAQKRYDELKHQKNMIQRWWSNKDK